MKLSVIVPVFNEESGLRELHARLVEAVHPTGMSYEIIYVDDGSADGSLEILEVFAKEDHRVKVLSFSRNFGHQNAVTAGLDFCSGDAAVIIDADLQDPPGLIPGMVEKWKEGFDVVYAVRRKREGETLFKKATAAFFYRFLDRMSDVKIPLDTGDFRLIDRKVIAALKQMPESNRFLRGMVAWTGFRQTGIEYDRDTRFAGKTKYPLKKMLRFAFNGITSFSTKPLSYVFYLGLIITIITFLGVLYVLYLKFFTERTLQGWTSLILAISLLGGIQLLSVGVIGLYISRITDEVKNRPKYLLRKRENLDEQHPVL
ncbi:MAG: glycosyltransferase family 2 protein [Bacteroidota bacterium]